jgi:hypothetical protein
MSASPLSFNKILLYVAIVVNLYEYMEIDAFIKKSTKKGSPLREPFSYLSFEYY